MFYHFKELTSTIDEAQNPRYTHGDVVVAGRQTAGRGQRGKRWSSAAGENLTFSVVLDTSFLRSAGQFAVLQTVALALVDTFAGYGLDARIKWPNDIYIGDRKIVGVLIDHSLGRDGMLARSGAGIGINVNQRTFDEWLPNPTSMALETGHDHDLREVLQRFHTRLMERFEELKGGASETAGLCEGPETAGHNSRKTAACEGPETAGHNSRKTTACEKLQHDYHSLLYRLDTPAQYTRPDGTRFTGAIRGVGPGGELTIDTSDGVGTFLFHEVSFVI